MDWNRKLKYLEFKRREGSKKYMVVDVLSKQGGEIAVIRYDYSWNKFVLEPLHATYYDTICLKDISDYLKELDDKLGVMENDTNG